MTAQSRVVAVDLAAIRRNAGRYRDSGRTLLARLDHDAFGMGLERVGVALGGAADWMVVDDVSAAAALRAAGTAEPILALSADGAVAAPRALHIAVATSAEAKAAARAGAAGVQLVVDCGGAARGVSPADAGALAEHAPLPVSGLMGVYGPHTDPLQAADAFRRVERWVQFRHLHGTRGAAYADAGEALRVGRGLYGVPGADGHPAGDTVLRFTGVVVLVKRILAGEGVSYGYIHRADSDSRIALVTGGYADGVARALGSAASVLVGGQLRPIVGRVAMDVCVVDLGDVAAQPGDEVVLLGDPARGEPGLADWAAASGLSPIELLCGIGPRVVREYRQ